MFMGKAKQQKSFRKKMSTLPEKSLIDFLESLEVEKNLSRLTIRNYAHYLRRFNDWFRNEGFSDLTSLDLDVLRKYRVYLARYQDEQGRTLSKKTQSFHIIALRSWFKWMIKHDAPVLHPEKID